MYKPDRHPSGSATAAAAATGAEWLWNCAGVCVGYRRGNSLYTHDGLEVGRFSAKEVYGPDGCYLGELSHSDLGGRLITNIYKKSAKGTTFVPQTNRSYRSPEPRPARAVYSGHEDFPTPETVTKRYFSPKGIKRLFRDSLGQDLVEYALAAAFVAVAAGALMPGVANSISTIFSKVTSILNAAGT